MHDATGNTVRSRLQPSISVGDYLVFGLDDTIWSTEKAWKFQVRFARTTGFLSNELCSVPAIPVPTSDATTQLSVSAERNGVALIGLELQLLGRSPSLRRFQEDIEIEPLLPQTPVNRVISLAEVTDELGRKLLHDRSYRNLDPLHFGVELPPDSRLLNLTFSIQEPVSIGFIGGINWRQF